MFVGSALRSPSWVELAGRNAAAEAVCVSASMRMTGRDGDQVLDERFDFWHGPGGLWRIERDGEVVYVATADGESLVRIDGQMRRLRGGDVTMVWLGPAFSPLDLLGLDSLLRKMSAGMTASSPQRTEVDGRLAWAVTLTARTGESIDLVFDDTTGVLVALSTSSRSGRLVVSNVVEHDRLDERAVRVRGPVVDLQR